MSQEPKNPANFKANAGIRPVLRLVPQPPEAAKEVVPATPEAGRRKSALAQFMNAYADSIDAQIKVLLDA